MNTELLNNILAKVKTLFVLPETATASEADQVLSDAIETKKPELVTGLVSQLTELVQAEATKLNEAYAAQLKAESDKIIGEFQSKISDFETKLSEIKPFDATDLESKLESIKAEFGSQILEIKGKVIPSTEGSEKTIETHKVTEKPAPIIKHFGAKVQS